MKIRVGIVGAGGNTRARHIPGLRAQPDVEIVSVCNRREESTAHVARELAIPRTYPRWEDLVDSDEIDAVVIGTWPYLHGPVTVAALEAGKHVLCEARMARNLEEARAMQRAARAHPGLVAQLVPAPFTLGVDRTIQRLLAEGFVGDLLAVEVRAGGAFLDRTAPLHWRQDSELSGLNIMSLGIWYESVMRWTGHATNVMAMGKVFVKARPDAQGVEREIRIPEHLNVVADLPGPAQLHMMISAVAGLAGGPEVWLFGSEGTLRFADETLFGGRPGEDRLQPIEIPVAEAGGWRVEEEFVNAIRGVERVARTTFEDGVRYMEFTEAVNRSLTTGRSIALPL